MEEERWVEEEEVWDAAWVGGAQHWDYLIDLGRERGKRGESSFLEGLLKSAL